MKFKIYILSIFTTLFLVMNAQADMEKAKVLRLDNKFEAALKEYLIDANEGNATAQYNVGFHYIQGKGTKRNYEKAFEWIQRSAEQGLTESQELLATMYDKGIGVAKNNVAAVKQLKLAADKGSPNALHDLAYKYMNYSPGLELNKEEANKLFELSAEKGNADSALMMSLFYGSRESATYNPTIAYTWFEIALGNNLDWNEGLVEMQKDGISTNMTPDQIQEAETKAKEWLQNHPHPVLKTKRDWLE